MADVGLQTTIADIVDLPTAETDDTLVLAPDGVGGVEFRAEAGGSGAVATDAIWTTSGKVAVATGTATATEQWPPGHEFDYVQITSGVNVTATTEATADVIVTSNAVTYDGSTIVLIEFSAVYVQTPPNVIARFYLYEKVGAGAAASIGQLAIAKGSDSTNVGYRPIFVARRMTPSSASIIYSIRGATASGTTVVDAGAGGTATSFPAFIRIIKV